MGIIQQILGLEPVGFIGASLMVPLLHSVSFAIEEKYLVPMTETTVLPILQDAFPGMGYPRLAWAVVLYGVFL